MRRAESVLVGSSAGFLAIAVIVITIAQNYWHPSKSVALLTTLLLPVSYAGVASASWVVRRKKKAEELAGILAAVAHLSCFPGALFLILYAGVQLFLLPIQALIIPALSLALSWALILPLSITAFVRSRLWIDLTPIPCYIAIAISSIPVMMTTT